MRFLWLLAIVLTLSARNKEVFASIVAPCIIQTVSWGDLGLILTSCEPIVTEVNDDDFTIDTTVDKSISSFNVANNKKLKFLPRNLHQALPDLIAFQSFNCSISVIGGIYFQKLSKLKLLHLKFNEIEQISEDAFVDLVSLEHLALNVNRIHFLGQTLFNSLINLKRLFFGYNEIYSLHPEIFKSLTNLESLDIRDNVITNLDDNIFSSLMNLKNFSSPNNGLKSISGKLLRNNLELENIWIDNNKLQFIEASVFDKMKNLKEVDLRGNLCVNKYYNQRSQFVAMKSDLMKGCTARVDDDSLGDKMQKLEETVEMLKPKLESLKAFEFKIKRLENEEEGLQRELDRQNLQILEQIELLGKRIEAFKQTLNVAG